MRIIAETAPANWKTKKGKIDSGLMPAKVLLKPRAKVTAGFANDVEEVNQ